MNVILVNAFPQNFTVMITNLKSIAFFSLLCCLFFSASAQKKNYGILTIKKEDIKTYYDSNVTTIVFKYKKPLFASYKLVGTPFDAAEMPLLTSFKPKKTRRHDKQKLQNLYKGILILYVEEMKDHGINGEFDIYFYPVPDSALHSFVSYLVNNTPDNVVKSKGMTLSLQAHAASGPADSPAPPPFSSFTLNPSPPYRSGER